MKKEKKEKIKKEGNINKPMVITGFVLLILQIAAVIATKITGFGESILTFDKLTFARFGYLCGYFSLAIIGLAIILYCVLMKNHKNGYLKNVVGELSKVKWPTKKEMITFTSATIVFCIFFGLFFYLSDLLFALVKGWLN